MSDTGVAVEDRRGFERDVLAKLGIDSYLPGQQEGLAGGRRRIRVHILVEELTKVGEQIDVTEGELEFLDRTFRVNVRIPNHRCRVERHRHFTDGDIEPTGGAP